MGDIEETQETQNSEGSEQSQTDYKALYESEQAKTAENAATITKLEKDGSSLRGQIRAQAGRDAEMGDTLSGLTSSVSALAKAQASGDSSGLLETIEKSESTAATATAQRRYEQRYTALHEALAETLTNGEGTVVLDMNDAPELESMRKLWNEAYNSDKMSVADRVDLYQQAIGEAGKAVRIKERSLKKAAEDEVKEAASEAKAQKLDNDSGANQVSTSEKSLDDLMKTKIKDLSPKELQEHNKKFWAVYSSEAGVKFKRE